MRVSYCQILRAAQLPSQSVHGALLSISASASALILSPLSSFLSYFHSLIFDSNLLCKIITRKVHITLIPHLMLSLSLSLSLSLFDCSSYDPILDSFFIFIPKSINETKQTGKKGVSIQLMISRRKIGSYGKEFKN